MNIGLTKTLGQLLVIVVHFDGYLIFPDVHCSSESIFLQSWLLLKLTSPSNCQQFRMVSPIVPQNYYIFSYCELKDTEVFWNN